MNPNSSKQQSKYLQKLGWKPKNKTATGAISVTLTILEELIQDNNIPDAVRQAAQEIINIKHLVKDISQINALLKSVHNGRIHGQIVGLGTRTGRCSHSKPNLAGIPKNEIRSLFKAPPGMTLIGCDAKALEARLLAHFLHPYDRGLFKTFALKSRKVDGEDVHDINARKLQTTRDTAKRFLYATMYGAGPQAINDITKTIDGQKLISKFKEHTKGYITLLHELKMRWRGDIIVGIDGRDLYCEYPHTILNTIIQNAGAVIMKRALLIMMEKAKGKNYQLIANVHDEIQLACSSQDVDWFMTNMPEAIRQAGEYYRVDCPMDGDAKSGDSWAATH